MGPTSNSFVQLFRYLFVASAAFSVDFGGLVALTELVGLHYLIAATISFCSGVAVNFYISTRWIFRNPKLSKRHHEFAATLLIGAIGLGLNNFILWTLTSLAGLFYIFSKLIATCLVFFWNFFARKKLLYYD